MSWEEDGILVTMENEFANLDHSDFAFKLRDIQPEFSKSKEFTRDVQIVIDENYINHILLGQFQKKTMTSLSEEILKTVPKNLPMYSTIMAGFFSTTVFSYIFPEILEEYNTGQRMDVRCSFSKEYISGKVKKAKTSQIWFRKGDKIELNINFGCGVYVHNKPDERMQLFSYRPIASDSEYWEQWRSFWSSMTGTIDFNFKNEDTVSKLMGAINKIDLQYEELKIYRGDKLKFNEKDKWQQKLDNFLGLIRSTPLKKVLNTYLFPNGLPLSPLPNIEECLGLSILDSNLEILEGYVRVGYDFGVTPADSSCLMNVFKKDPDRMQKLVEEYQKKFPKLQYRLPEKGAKLFGGWKQ